MFKTIPAFSIAIVNAAVLAKDGLDTAAAAVSGEVLETLVSIAATLSGVF